MILKLSPPRCGISKESTQQKWIDELWFRKQLSTCLFVWTLNYNDLVHLLSSWAPWRWPPLSRHDWLACHRPLWGMTYTTDRYDIYPWHGWHIPLKGMAYTTDRYNIYHREACHMPLTELTYTTVRHDIYHWQVWHTTDMHGTHHWEAWHIPLTDMTYATDIFNIYHWEAWHT